MVCWHSTQIKNAIITTIIWQLYCKVCEAADKSADRLHSVLTVPSGPRQPEIGTVSQQISFTRQFFNALFPLQFETDWLLFTLV